MAGIDKTYIDSKEYPLYREWWLENYDKMVKDIGHAIWLYPFHVFYKEDDITPKVLQGNEADIRWANSLNELIIWNTTESEDKWLLKNCKIKSFVERMIEVYPRNWKGFKGVNLPRPKDRQRYKR